MIYDVTKHKIFYGYFVKKEYKLSRTECRILNVLLDCELHSAKEIADKSRVLSETAVRSQISKMRKKGLDIKSRYELGYQLNTSITIGDLDE